MALHHRDMAFPGVAPESYDLVKFVLSLKTKPFSPVVLSIAHVFCNASAHTLSHACDTTSEPPQDLHRFALAGGPRAHHFESVSVKRNIDWKAVY